MTGPDKTEQPEKRASVGLVSLGCPKALVDSEHILTRLRAEGYAISPSYDGADVVLVNTCGFLDTAKQESLEAITEALAENGKVIVTGCMGTDPEAIRRSHPDVLAITGPAEVDALAAAVRQAVPLSRPHTPSPPRTVVPGTGLRLTPPHFAYLKISEGCDHGCSFCIIPKLRGPLVSRRPSDILAEAEQLVAGGVKELMVISQDTGAYGVDLGHAADAWEGQSVPAHLVDLAANLGDLGAWVRLMYVYPYPHIDALIPLMADSTLLPYIDIPFQHASPAVLKRMRRPAKQDRLLERLAAWRAEVPDLTVRSSFIVGFPGESDADFDALLAWLEAAELDRVGCFRYEAVAGTDAALLPDPVPTEVIDARWHRFMQTQQAISTRRMAARIGTDLDVLIDEVDEDGAIGRSMGDAPEIDGSVFLNGDTTLAPGDIVQVTVTAADAYDLWAERSDEDAPIR